jgi:rSAM/selenodomain-associated transferase 2/rSAM/selenodomain-associated transferase 1
MIKKHSFSVIIPTLNEAEAIGACIAHINNGQSNVEIIVVDGGSSDATIAVAESAGVKVIHTGPCRGLQCNYGAAAATGEILIFLHADTILPNGAFDQLSEIFSNDEVKIGNFGIVFDTKHWFLRLLSFLSRFDMGLFRFGDQGIVIRKSFFDRLGGFPNWTLFEDFQLIRAARKETRIHRFSISVVTSARRFVKNGIIRQQIKNVYFTIQYLLGVPPWRLAEKYYGNRRKSDKNLVVFLRFPSNGEVKTRLARTIGNEMATRFYRECAEHLFREVEELPQDIVRHIYYTPRNAGKSVERWAGRDYYYQAQANGNLGKRLETIFHDQFKKGFKKVMIIATDVPDITVTDIKEAFNAMGEADLVIGPSFDGGYYLIGMKELHPSLFDGIAWSTNIVYDQTLAIAAESGLRVHNLRTLDDIDTEEDLHRWRKRSLPANDNYTGSIKHIQVVSENGK